MNTGASSRLMRVSLAMPARRNLGRLNILWWGLAVVEGRLVAQPLGQQVIHLSRAEGRQRRVGGDVEAPQGLESRHVDLAGHTMGEGGRQGAVDGGEAFLVAEQTGRAGLGNQNAAGVQPGLGNLIVLAGVEKVGRPAFQRVNQVHDHHVELLAGAGQVGAGVLVQQLQTGGRQSLPRWWLGRC